MKLYGDANGAIVRMLQTDAEEALYGPPDGYVSSLEFDPDSNPSAIAGLLSDTRNHQLLGGILYHNGQAVTINPPSQTFTDRQQLATLRSQAAAYLNLASPTAAQNVAAIKGIIRLLGLVFDWYLKGRL